MATTSLSFYAAGGESLGAYGHSKDHRADLKQMIPAVVIDGEGRPILHRDAATQLLSVIDRLRERFHIGRVCVVADRGMTSAAAIAALESASWNTSSTPVSAAALCRNGALSWICEAHRQPSRTR